MISVEQLRLKDLRRGADFKLTILDSNVPRDDDASRNAVLPEYLFTVKVRSKMPLCRVELLDEFGHVERSDEAILLGGGQQTTTKNNPLLRGDWFMEMPHRDSAIVPDYGQVAVMDSIMLADPTNDTGAWFDLGVCMLIETRDS